MTTASAIGQGEVSALGTALRKARRRIIPLLAICYLVAYMDRTNISFAAETMNRDLRFSPSMYGLGAGLFFLSYALCEIPSNWMLLRFGARRWLARIMLTWGLLAGAMLLVHTPWSFYAMRLLLGVAEAGFFPGVIMYLATWFPREQARAGHQPVLHCISAEQPGDGVGGRGAAAAEWTHGVARLAMAVPGGGDAGGAAELCAVVCTAGRAGNGYVADERRERGGDCGLWR